MGEREKVEKRVIGYTLVVAATVLLVVLSGCGGGGSEALTKTEFVRKGETICGKMLSEREEVIARFFRSSPDATLAEREATMLETLVFYGKAANHIGELTPPPGDEKTVEAIVAAMEEAVETTKADPGTVLTNSAIAFKKANSLLKRYGIHHCSI